jgi:ATP diphosphatase
MKPSRDVSRLIEIMAALRTPVTGCPWDLKQDFASIAPYTIEEAHEVADAIRRRDMVDLADELGDLLLQVVYHAQMAEEAGHFAFPDVVEAITTKLIRRHPHVFGDRSAGDPSGVKELWDEIKAEEKAARRAARAALGLPDDTPQGVLSGVKSALPALTRAVKLQQKASSVGFDWKDARLVIDKIEEEAREVREALDSGNASDIREEIGDLMFALVNLARHAEVEPEAVLQEANDKFQRRFRQVELALAAQGRSPAEATLDEMERLWVAAKAKV